MIISDVNLLAPTITLAVGIALGYRFRGLIAREERQALEDFKSLYYSVVAEYKKIKSAKAL